MANDYVNEKVNYYTKEILKEKVKQLENALGCEIKLVSSSGKYSLSGSPFGFTEWYHTAKELIIYLDGVLNGLGYKK